MPIAVFILDDHQLVRRGLREILVEAGEIEVVGESGSAREATPQILALRPDVAVLDARLPDGSGIAVCREVRTLAPDVQVIILTSYDDPQDLRAAVDAGASACILKEIHGADLADAVRRVAAGDNLIGRPAPPRAGTVGAPPPAGPVDLPAQRLQPPAAGPPGRTPELTPQETRVLDLIVEGLTNRQIGERLNIAEKTVKNHITSLMAKLQVSRRTQAAVYGARLRGGY